MKNVLLDHPLSPDGTRPVMCIDEAQVMILDICGEVCMMQVLDPTLGWGTFRQDYGSTTWAWLSAATGARLHRSIESDTNMPFIILAQDDFDEWVHEREYPC